MYKIFVDAHVFDGEYQGTLTYIKELYTNILEVNNKVTIYFGANKIENVKKNFDKYPNAQFVQYTSKGRLNRIFIEIPRIINDLNCTHAHFQYIIPFKKHRNCKYIVTIHDILFNDFPKEFSKLYRLQRNGLFYLSAKRSDYLLTVSNYSKRKISEQYNIKESDIIVTLNAVSEEFYQFNSTKIESRTYIFKKFNVKKFILYVSRIEPRKNQILLLNAFVKEKLWERGFTLVLIGSNSLQSGLFEELESLENKIRKSIVWIEQVSDIELKHFLNAAECFVYPTKAEGFGIPPLEAGVLLTPVLCSNATAMDDFEFFKPHFFDPDDTIEFNKLFLNFIENNDMIDLKAIRKTISNRYRWEESAKIMLEKIIYES